MFHYYNSSILRFTAIAGKNRIGKVGIWGIKKLNNNHSSNSESPMETCPLSLQKQWILDPGQTHTISASLVGPALVGKMENLTAKSGSIALQYAQMDRTLTFSALEEHTFFINEQRRPLTLTNSGTAQLLVTWLHR
ncbi:MAG TPA: hypothetical protein DCE41_20470 [Cytophagales bacterium]|nr:hypothetical protein [Cytophagales bacterium]HAA20739.1 hypothetical protein [Cytophagales bacterium]HAP62329.1 hypothetical protein [Cytophagales bacterium]